MLPPFEISNVSTYPFHVYFVCLLYVFREIVFSPFLSRPPLSFFLNPLSCLIHSRPDSPALKVILDMFSVLEPHLLSFLSVSPSLNYQPLPILTTSSQYLFIIPQISASMHFLERHPWLPLIWTKLGPPIYMPSQHTVILFRKEMSLLKGGTLFVFLTTVSPASYTDFHVTGTQ